MRRYEAILAGSILLLTGAVIPSSWEPLIPVALPPAPAPPLLLHRPWIALTFDDGPHPVMTERLLKVLRQEHVPATFFVVGKMADRYPQLVEEIAQDGHEIDNHTYTHPRITRLSGPALMSELAQTREVIHRLTGQNSIYYRPPGGDYSRETVRLASQAGYHMILWSVLTNDVVGAGPTQIMRRVERDSGVGGIILMHSGIKTTVNMLPEIIGWLRQRGYSFVTVSTLMKRASGVPKDPAPVPLMQTVMARAAPPHSTVQ